MIFLTRVEGQDHRHHPTFGQGLVSRLVGRYSGHGQLTGLDCLRLGKPGEVDFLDQAGEGLGLELRAAQPFFDPHDEDLVESLDGQAVQLFTLWLSSHLAVLLFDRGDFPTFYRYLPYGTTIAMRLFGRGDRRKYAFEFGPGLDKFKLIIPKDHIADELWHRGSPAEEILAFCNYLGTFCRVVRRKNTFSNWVRWLKPIQ